MSMFRENNFIHFRCDLEGCEEVLNTGVQNSVQGAWLVAMQVLDRAGWKKEQNWETEKWDHFCCANHKREAA
jgi:hypothetical protein